MKYLLHLQPLSHSSNQFLKLGGFFQSRQSSTHPAKFLPHLSNMLSVGKKIKESVAIQVPCQHKHFYDRDCLRELALLSTRDESLMPIRCDGTDIPLRLLEGVLSPKEFTSFNKKRVEFGTTNRLYCSTPSCSDFLGTSSSTKVAILCNKCGASSCRACRAPWHGAFGLCGASDAVAVLARKFGCQQCPRCRRVVEMSQGCYHMYVSLTFRHCRGLKLDCCYSGFQDLSLLGSVLLRLRGGVEDMYLPSVG